MQYVRGSFEAALKLNNWTQMLPTSKQKTVLTSDALLYESNERSEQTLEVSLSSEWSSNGRYDFLLLGMLCPKSPLSTVSKLCNK